jgi:hypothetical protein
MTKSERQRDWVSGEYCFMGHIAVTKFGGGKSGWRQAPSPDMLGIPRAIESLKHRLVSRSPDKLELIQSRQGVGRSAI